MNKVWVVTRNFILSSFALYGYNLIAASFNLVVPINIFSILFVGFLGIPALFGLVLLKIMMF